jgi:hypothetical protein
MHHDQNPSGSDRISLQLIIATPISTEGTVSNPGLCFCQVAARSTVSNQRWFEQWSSTWDTCTSGDTRRNIWVYTKTYLRVQTKKKANSVAFGPQANYTDWATATCWRKLVPTFADRGVSRGQCVGSPTAVNLCFLDQNRYFFSSSFVIYPHKGWVNHVPDPTLKNAYYLVTNTEFNLL